MTVVHSKAS